MLEDDYIGQNLFAKKRPKEDFILYFKELHMSKKWSEKELKLFKRLYLTKPMEELIQTFNRSKSALVSKANHIGIKREIKSDGSTYYTNEEKEYIVENSRFMSIEEIAEKLGRTIISVKSMAEKLDVSYGFWWNNSQINFLIENFEEGDRDYICNTLGRNWKAISKKAREIGLNRKKKNGEKYVSPLPLKKTEDEFILEKSFLLTSSEIAKYLGRSINFVDSRCEILGLVPLKKRKNPNNFSNDDLIEFIKILYKEIGHAPSSEDIQNDKRIPSIDIYYDRFGSYTNALIMSGIDLFSESSFGRRCISKSGEFCFSIPEKEITDFLFDRGIEYRKEVLYLEIIPKISKKYVADWVLYDNTIVEYFGLENKVGYNEKTMDKISMCNKNFVNIISIYKKDLSNLEEIFRNYLK